MYRIPRGWKNALVQFLVTVYERDPEKSILGWDIPVNQRAFKERSGKSFQDT